MYINTATNNTIVAVLYVVATCGSLLFSKIKDMVALGLANVGILLVVMAIKRYAFTSVWCAYAAVASLIILAYFWKSHRQRPFRYVIAQSQPTHARDVLPLNYSRKLNSTTELLNSKAQRAKYFKVDDRWRCVSSIRTKGMSFRQLCSSAVFLASFG